MKRGFRIRDKKKRIAGTILLFFVLFLAAGVYHQKSDVTRADDCIIRDSEGKEVTEQYDLHRATDTFSVYGASSTDTFLWTSANDTILTVDSATARSSTVRVNAIAIGDVALNLKITHADGTIEDIGISIRVSFSINEYLNATDKSVSIVRVNESDERKSIVMDYDSTLYFGKNAKTDTNKLNLIFGDATQASWTSSNSDVVRVNSSAENPLIKAAGAGRAKLTVSYTDGAQEYTDTIYVYVRPRLTYKDNIVGAGTDGPAAVTMENGDKLGVSALFYSNPLESISDKLVWVIAKDVGENTVLVRDSMGNKGADADDANLVFNSTSCTYRLDAKAGIYKVLFYVVGSYSDFDSVQANQPGCAPVSLGVTVNSDFTDKDVTVNIGGNYSLADAFNIPLSTLKNNFTVTVENNPDNCTSYSSQTMKITALKEGKATFTVTKNAHTSVDIPGLTRESVRVIVTVSESFSLNVASTTIAVGSSLELSGIIASGQFAEASSFEWSSTDTNETYVSLQPNGQYATVTAKRMTQSNKPVTITLAWTDDEGVTRVASCDIFVSSTATSIVLDRTSIEMEAGDVEYLDSGLTGNQNLTWISSDTNVVSVTPQAGNTTAKLTAGNKGGTAVITVINKDNNVYATCIVTVSVPIEELSIDKGPTYETKLSEGYVFLKAVYKPTNATSTDLIWSSRDPDIATVDQNGVVTLLKEGNATIRVRPKFNPGNRVPDAECIIMIKKNPITKITTDVTDLSMIAGDSYTVTTTIDPTDATDPTLTWASGDEKIAKVDGGIITAVAPGDTYITVAGGEADTVVIQVHVRNRLKSIAFEQSEYTIKKGDTAKLNVIFDPAENVNTNLTWKSTNEQIVSVAADGTLTAVDEGMAMITCIAEDIGVSGAISCIIHVTQQDVIPTDMTLDPSEGTVYIGSTIQINAVFTPNTATDQTVKWESVDPSIATVDDTGLVTGVAEGTVTITAQYTNTTDANNPISWVRYSKITVEKAPVAVTGVTVDPTAMDVYIGQTGQVNAIVAPEDATDKSVTFQSSDTAVATVDATGLVTGVATGSAAIVCRTNDGGYLATCQVNVTQGIYLGLQPPSREIAIGKSFTIQKIVSPENADQTAVWETSNKNIATVSEKGVVTGVAKGTVTITCTLTKYNTRAVCQVTVNKLRSTIRLNKTKIRMGVGESYRLKATTWSNNTNQKPSVKWTSSNKKLAAVSSKGNVRAKKIGLVTIMATTKDTVKAKAKCKIRIIQRATAVRLHPNYAICYVGRTKKLSFSVRPKNATIKRVSWKTSDNSIATVTDGMVRGVAAGTVTITATERDGSRKKAKCIVRVLDEVPVTSVVIAQQEMTMKRGDSAKLKYSVLPSDTSDSLKYASDNNRVAKISSNGVVKAIGTGSCTITILASGGVSSTVTIHVVEMNRSTLTMRQYDTETLWVNGTTNTVTWYSSNARVASVDNTGKVTGRGKGTTYIYAYVDGCKMGCRVKITALKKR